MWKISTGKAKHVINNVFSNEDFLTKYVRYR